MVANYLARWFSALYSSRGVLTLSVVITAWRLATLVAHPFNLSFDEAQYWIWAQAPAWGYFSKPPMIGWIISLSTNLCGDSEPCIRLGAPLAYLVVSLALYDVGRRLYTPGVGFWSAIVFITLPGVAFSSMLMSVDPLLLMFWSIALAVLVRALAEEHTILWWTLGGIIGLGLLTKYTMLFFPVSLLLYLTWSHHRQCLWTVGPWLAIVLGCISLLPNLLWNAANSFATLVHTGQNIHLITNALFHPDNGFTFVSTLFAVFGPIPMIAFSILIIRIRYVLICDDKSKFLLSFSLPVLLIMTTEAFLSRAHANWSAPAFESATVLVVAWLMRLNRDWLLKIAVSLHIAAAIVLYNLDWVTTVAGYTLVSKNDPFKRVRGWDSIGRQIIHIRADYPGSALLFDTRKVLAPVVYYARPSAFDAVIWNETDTVANHFELVTDLNQAIGLSFLLITEQHTAAHVAHAFAKTELVAVLRVVLHKHFMREIHIFQCKNFKGYSR